VKIFEKSIEKEFSRLSEFIFPSDVIYLEIDLMRFGKVLNNNIKKEDFLNFFFNLFKNLVGPKGHIIVPSFSYSWGDNQRNKLFDVKNTSSKTGIFPEYFRKAQGVHRTLDPMFSFLIYGKNSSFFTDIGNDSFGKNSLFEKIHNKKAKLVSFGLDKFDPTFVHYVEQYFDSNYSKIKYRYLKKFEGALIDKDGKKLNTAHYSFMRSLDSKVVYDETGIKESLKSKKKLQTIKIENGIINIANATDFFDLGIEGMKKNINFFSKTKI
tara:strand:- start:214 stop:1014 length:801 start_codon:yes stop_codon:yes gene_type:complete